MAFVNHDQVEEAGREFAEELLPVLRAGDGLIEAEIDLIGGVDAAFLIKRQRQLGLRTVVALNCCWC